MGAGLLDGKDPASVAAGAAGILSVPAFFAAAALGTPGLVAALLLAVPAVLVLGHQLRERPGGPAPAAAATLLLAGSYLAWAGIALTGAWAWEPLHLALAAAGWGLFAALVRPGPRWFFVLTALAAGFAASDAVVTAVEDHVPFWVFALLGGPKLPLQFAWQVALGLRLLRAR